MFIKLEMDTESDVAKNTHVSVFVYYDAVLVDSFFNGFWVHQIWFSFTVIPSTVGRVLRNKISLWLSGSKFKGQKNILPQNLYKSL